jgi:8-hydroxy-5-deazaflavin:NADPH oxidoreductase
VSNPKPVIGILGAGKLGIVLAQLALKAGYTVYIAGSGTPDKIALSTKIITPGAQAVTAIDAITKADIVILALPLSKYKQLPVEALAGKLVIDSMNYWWEVDGEMEQLRTAKSSSEMVQEYLEGARIVKALSHMGYHNLFDDTRPRGAKDRKAIAVAGNNDTDNKTVSMLVNDLGFDPVIIGNLHTGKILEPGHALFGASVNSVDMRGAL